VFFFELEAYGYLVAVLAMLAVKAFAFISAISFPAEAYPAASRGNKVGWAIGLGLGFVAQLMLMGARPLNLISLAFLIAALVYVADTRPALAEVTSTR
jgi:hypothetical protein